MGRFGIDHQIELRLESPLEGEHECGALGRKVAQRSGGRDGPQLTIHVLKEGLEAA